MLASFIIYIVVALLFSAFVPIHTGKATSDQDHECPDCGSFAPASAWVRVGFGLLWPIVTLVFVAALMVSARPR